jgi:flagellar hook-associated protein 3 FlgL
MRVTFDAQHRAALDNVNRASERLLVYQRQVTSGKRVERPSDDPSAAAAASVERATLAETDQYTATTDSARGRLLVIDTVLSDVIQQITASQVAVTAARGSTLTPAQREAKAQELEVLRDAVLQDVNTKFRGTYVFGGASATVQPYARNNAGVVSAYQGSAVEVSVDIDNSLEVPTALNGEALARGNDVDDVFTVFNQAITAARAGDTNALSTAAAGLQRAFDRAIGVQSRVGAALRSVEDGQLRLAEATRSTESRLTTLVQVNMASAITNMTQAETVYQAALAATSRLQQLSLMDYLR